MKRFAYYFTAAGASPPVLLNEWDTWEECAPAFENPRNIILGDHRLFDNETGREWLPGARYEWEDART